MFKRLVCVLLWVCGCEGAFVLETRSVTGGGEVGGVGGGGGAAGGTGGGGDVGGAAAGGDVGLACTKPDERGLSTTSVARLTKEELRARLRAAVGDGLMADATISAQLAGLPAESAKLSETVPSQWARVLHTVAKRAITLGLGDPAWRSSMLGACANAAVVTPDCVRSVVGDFATRATGRPLGPAELDALVTATTAGCPMPPPPLEFPWSDPVVFFGDDVMRLSGPVETVTRTGWFVWPLPASRVTTASTRLLVDVVVSGGPTTFQVNLNDAPVLQNHVVAVGPATIEAVASVPAGAAAKVGVSIRALPAGGSVRFVRLRLAGPATASSDCVSGHLGFTLRRVLQSPAMVFHLEGGTPATANRLRVTANDVAVRLASMTGQNGPDAPLLEAARTGQLETVEQARAQARRLLDTPAGRARVREFFRYTLHLDLLAQPAAGVSAYRNLSNVGLEAELAAEALDFSEAIVWHPSENRFSNLMTSTSTKPATARLATILGVPGQQGQTVSAPKHPGLVHRPALLASSGARTSPILRGAHVVKLLLCQEMAPDMVAVQQQVEAVGSVDHLPNREAVTTLTAHPNCVGCHQLINPVGFAFEHFDQLGMPRTEEVVFDVQGRPVRTFPMTTDVKGLTLPGSEPFDVRDSRELAEKLATSPRAQACFAQRAFEYYRRRKPTPGADDCAVSDAQKAVRDGRLVDVFAATIANDDLFYRAAP
ncbi:MAG: DUF1588 domain-containing protein [Myxococcaceae bacterium]|nr:DUF1588 domain-containing protein [Myxococcaceae bacterium]